jgi:hypothetical protein
MAGPSRSKNGVASLARSRLKNGVASLAYGPGHPRLKARDALKTWMPGIKPGMTFELNASRLNILERDYFPREETLQRVGTGLSPR